MILDFFRRWWLGVVLIHQLSRFIADCFKRAKNSGMCPRGSTWIYLPYAKVYVRFGPIFLNNKRAIGITLAGVEVYPEYYRRGFLKVILCVIENRVDIDKYDVVMVENIHNGHLRDYLIKRKYQPIQLFPFNLYKEMSKK